MPLRIILLVNAVAMIAAAMVLALAPGLIPKMAGIILPDNGRFVTDLLAASELALAVLAIVALRSRAGETIRLAVWALVTLHAASGLFALLALGQGLSAVVGANVVARAVMVSLLWWFGLRPAVAAPKTPSG